MAYKVKLLNLAENDLDEICHYLSQFYPGTAGRFLDAIEQIFNNISQNPKMYPLYEYNKEYRKAVTNNFLVFYKTDKKNTLINIYRILHGKQNIISILTKLDTKQD